MAIIKGQKGGKGGGSSYRAPVEEPNSLQSTQNVAIVDVISEGEIEGLSTGDAKSIFFNETPLKTQSGAMTYNDVSWALIKGLPDQSALSIDAGATATTAVGVEITHDYPKASGSGSGAYTFVISNQNCTSVRITVGVQGLYKTLTNQENAGDVVKTSVSGNIKIRNSANELVVNKDFTIEGKTTSSYYRDYTFGFQYLATTDGAPYTVTVSRLTADNEDSTIQNDLYLSSYTEVVGYALTYPHTAAMLVSSSAESFGNSVPTRAYKVKGIKVQVPVNYNPVTRTYSGVWNGTFKRAWTNNPAWIFYDLVMSDRYGLRHYMPELIKQNVTLCDKWTLYEISQICDAPVSDGNGGTEPRFTFNYQIMGADNASTVLQYIASVFHGMTYWCSGTVYAKSDYPTDPIRTLTQANVISGKINYSTGSLAERHSVCLVTWYDPDDFCKASVEEVFDWELYQKIGYRALEVTATGCTSRGQAHRHGLWELATEAEKWQATVEVGLDGFDYLPGDVVRIADPAWMGYRAGGRIEAISGRVITLDTLFERVTGESYQLALYMADGTEQVRSITSFSDSDGKTKATVATAFTGEIVDHAVWSIRGTQTSPRLFAIRNISEKDKHTLTLTLREVNPYKYQNIEQNLQLEPNPTRRAKGTEVRAPINLDVQQLVVDNNSGVITKALFSWEQPSADDFGYVRVNQWRVVTTDPYGNTTQGEWQNTIGYEMRNIVFGPWTFGVQARGINGQLSAVATISVDLDGDVDAPAAPSNVVATTGYHLVKLTWTDPDDFDLDCIRIFRSTDGINYTKVSEVKKGTETWTDENVYVYTWYKLRAVDAARNVSVDSVVVMSDRNPPAVPTDLAANGGYRLVNVTWTDPPDGDLDHIVIYRSGNGVDYLACGQASPGEQLFIDANLAIVTTYWYKIKAVDWMGNESELTEPISVTTEAIPMSEIPDFSIDSRKTVTDIFGDSEHTANAVVEEVLNNYGDNKAAGVQITETKEILDDVTGRWAVRIDNNKRVSGIALLNGEDESNFTVLADKFLVTGGGANDEVIPVFEVDTTTGKSYLKGDLIAEGTITGNMINARTRIQLADGGELLMGEGSVLQMANGVFVVDSTEGHLQLRDPNNISNGDYVDISGGQLSMYHKFSGDNAYTQIKSLTKVDIITSSFYLPQQETQGWNTIGTKTTSNKWVQVPKVAKTEHVWRKNQGAIVEAGNEFKISSTVLNSNGTVSITVQHYAQRSTSYSIIPLVDITFLLIG